MDGTVTGGSAKKLNGKKLLIILLIAAVLIAATVVGVLWYRQAQQVRLTASDRIALQDTDGQGYDLMTDAELGAHAKKEVGKTLEQLKTEKLGVTSFLTFNQAYKGARILAAAGSYKQSTAAYKAAEGRAIGGQKSRDFYNDYAGAADLAGDTALATELLEKQIEMIKKQPNLTDFQRQQQIDEISSKLELRKMNQ